jgi:hypothetical protein
MRSPMPPWIAGAALAAVLVAGGAGVATASPARERVKPAHSYPNSIAVLGHSGATGEDSDPARPHEDARQNSWATGANPAVNSVYRRILAVNPAIRGHAYNGAWGGATVGELAFQAKLATKRKHDPELFLIQTMDNDVVCPAGASDYAAFRSKLVTALKVLARRAPASRIFVVSQFGSPGTYWQTLTPDQRKAIGGTGPCSFVAPGGELAPEGLARFESVLHAYEAQLAAACRRVRQCTYDGGAFGREVDRSEYNAEDLHHLSIKGHARAAAVAWRAMKRLGVIPR